MRNLTPFERFQRRLVGEPVDRTPNFNILMTFAAHYIHKPLSQYYLDYRVLAEANLAVQEAFDLDILQVISDPYREAADFGLQVDFPYDGLPVAAEPLLAKPADLMGLKSPEPGTGRRMSDRLEAIRHLGERKGGQVPIMGWVEGALAEAADLRGMFDLMKDLTLRPEWVVDLLNQLVEVEVAFALAQVEAGADIIGLGDAVASQISPKMYRKFALPYEKRIFEAVHKAGGKTRLHICGNSSHILDDMIHSGADIIDIDWMVDIQRAAEVFGDRAGLCGNFNPVQVMLQGQPPAVAEAVLKCQEGGGNKYFSAAGCEIPDGTPVENLLAQSKALKL
ncbi:MAG: uroporphyrinogen decarboxylase family protein [Chloroflexota bacterium]|nr:MAG: uroporphyrinogen decarboxylase family protein [Chloroflexota bacterium]